LTTKMLASTVQFSNNTPPTTHTHHLPAHPTRGQTDSLAEDGTGQKQQPHPRTGSNPRPETPPQGIPAPGATVVLSGPNRMSSPPHHQPTTTRSHATPKSTLY
jgi:hypothetical protein